MIQLVDDRRAGLVLRALRRRRGLRQLDVALMASVSQTEVSLLERGHVDRASLRALRAVYGAVDASVEIDLRWRGGTLDRIMDERHAALAEEVVRRLTSVGWQAVVEVSYSVYGERGSVDVLAVRSDLRVALIIELKSELNSQEETHRRFDAKVRLAPGIVADRFGWRPVSVGRLLVLLDNYVNRARVARYRHIFDANLPMRGPALRAWLRQPGGRPAAGVWFVRLSTASAGKRGPRGPDRIRVPRRRPS